MGTFYLLSILLAAKQKKSSVWDDKGFVSAVLFILIVLVAVFLVLLIFNTFKFPL